MEAGKRTINDIFNGNRIIEIPFFQRSYVWGEKQWQRLLEDFEYVSQTNKPYFLGSIILKQVPTPGDENIGDKRILIDGQQRLTTLNILFKVLCLKLNDNHTHNRIFRLLSNEIALHHNYRDLEDFNLVMNLTEEIELRGSSSVIKAYNYFKVQDITSLNVSRILNNIMLVGIDLSTEDDEQQIFDTINSLGISLTTAELLKNYFFKKTEISSYIDNWFNVFENEERKDFWENQITAGRSLKENIDLFFYSFLQIKIQDSSLKVNSEDKKMFTKVEGLFNSYKKFIKNYKVDKHLLINEIKEYAEVYFANIDYDIVNREIPQEYGIERINCIIFGLENTTLIPYILFVLKNVTDIEERNNIFEYLETYIMRRMVCHESTKNYNQLFSERLIANNVLTKEALKDYIETQSDKVNYMPSDSELKNGFLNSKLVNKQSLGVLYFLESKIRNRDLHSTSLRGLNTYSLEHILPKKWEDHWHKLSTEEEIQYRNRVLLTLGNLTIISIKLNPTISNSDWKTKKTGKNSYFGLIKYSAGLETFSSYLDREVWNEEVIYERALELFEHAKNNWKI